MFRKKLIEVALPLEAINRESAREKSIRHGHPSTLHLWWARRPLAACRAVLFASLVDDPSSHPERFPTEEAQEAERQRLFRIIEQLVKWENTTNEHVLAAARNEILKATDGNPPPVLDPFCGGGSIPLEAQRLGLEAHASDLNPVAVLITKALIEIPPRFAGRPPVNPEARRKIGHGDGWRGAQGLAEDVRYYGKWMRDEAERCIGHLYPKVRLSPEQGGGEATVIAWLWARTVRCPSPACGAEMPLVTSFWLATKKGKQAWVEPVVDRTAKSVHFEVGTGLGFPADPPKIGRGAKFRCLVCGQTADEGSLRREFRAKRNGMAPLATVAQGVRGRIYVTTPDAHVKVADSAVPNWQPEEAMNTETPNLVSGRGYGVTHWHELFTARQLVALTTFSDLVGQARERARADALAAGLTDNGVGINDGGTGATAYADAVATYLAFALSKMADRGSTICTWFTERDSTRNTFARQAIPMTWDFAELNTLLRGTGSFLGAVEWTAETVAGLAHSPAPVGHGKQADAATLRGGPAPVVSCTDPPYYDNIGYADLADFFFVWLRRSIGDLYPDLFATRLTPKAEELVASPYRFGGSKAKAADFFERGLTAAFHHLRALQSADYPLTVFYAFKQAESEVDSGNGDGKQAVASTGWETMLEGLMKSGFAINGTWPMRSELSNRMIGLGTNALASSIVLVCRPRLEGAPVTTRRDFVAQLKKELPAAMKTLQRGGIAPVDLAQAAIGPGMGVFSKYHRVLEADGTSMPVRTALQLINGALDEVLAEQEGEFDPETRWAIAWFEQFGMNEGQFGVAETLSKAKNTASNALVEAGIVAARQGRVRLLRREELPTDWDPTRDRRVTIWEVTQHLIRLLERAGEQGAARLLGQVGGLGEAARDLAYRLYVVADRKKWAQEALGYNSLVVAWPEISRLAGRSGGPEQGGLDL